MAKPPVYRTPDGYTVQAVSTADRGAWFQVTCPYGIAVPLDPWNPQHCPPIRTWPQLVTVLSREGQDAASLTEARS